MEYFFQLVYKRTFAFQLVSWSHKYTPVRGCKWHEKNQNIEKACVIHYILLIHLQQRDKERYQNLASWCIKALCNSENTKNIHLRF